MPKHILRLNDPKNAQAILKAVETLEFLGRAPQSCVTDSQGRVVFAERRGVRLSPGTFSSPSGDVFYRLFHDMREEIDSSAGSGGDLGLLLACSLYRQCLRLMTGGENPVVLCGELAKWKTRIVERLRERILPFPDQDWHPWAKALLDAQCDDTELKRCIMEAVADLGTDGFIRVETSYSAQCEYRNTQGHSFARGYMSDRMATDSNTRECILKNPLIVVSERPISLVDDLLYFMEECGRKGRPLLLIVEHVETKPLQVLLFNQEKGSFRSAAVWAPRYGTERKLFLSDIAAVAGATVIAGDVIDIGPVVDGRRDWIFGSADKVVVEKSRTTIYGGGGDQKEVRHRALHLRGEYDRAAAGDERDFIAERLTFLEGGAGKITVGGVPSQAASREQTARRLLTVLRDARKHGVTPDAADTLCLISQEMERAYSLLPLRKEVCDALEAPLQAKAHRTGLLNAGMEIVRVKESGDNSEFDFANGGVLDSANALLLAVDKAFSLVPLLLRTEYLVADTPGSVPTPISSLKKSLSHAEKPLFEE